MKNEPSLISMHPFVRAFVLNIVRTIKEKKFGGEKFVIDAEMVPRVSGDVMMASMGAGVVRPKLEEREKPVVVRRDMSELVAPIDKPTPRAVHVMAPKPTLPELLHVAPPVKVEEVAPVVKVEVIAPEVASKPVDVVEEGYGKIIPLLNDPSVTTIECDGKKKDIMVVRAGQRQRTRIVLQDEEIMNILDKVAEETHIPLIEGIFRASLPEFSVSAVVSKVVGSRFVIKKVTAYNLIE